MPPLDATEVRASEGATRRRAGAAQRAVGAKKMKRSYINWQVHAAQPPECSSACRCDPTRCAKRQGPASLLHIRIPTAVVPLPHQQVQVVVAGPLPQPLLQHHAPPPRAPTRPLATIFLLPHDVIGLIAQQLDLASALHLRVTCRHFRSSSGLRLRVLVRHFERQFQHEVAPVLSRDVANSPLHVLAHLQRQLWHLLVRDANDLVGIFAAEGKGVRRARLNYLLERVNLSANGHTMHNLDCHLSGRQVYRFEVLGIAVQCSFCHGMLPRAQDARSRSSGVARLLECLAIYSLEQ